LGDHGASVICVGVLALEGDRSVASVIGVVIVILDDSLDFPGSFVSGENDIASRIVSGENRAVVVGQGRDGTKRQYRCKSNNSDLP